MNSVITHIYTIPTKLFTHLKFAIEEWSCDCIVPIFF